jgi:hypothetical protein
MPPPCTVADNARDQLAATAKLASHVRRLRRLHCHACPQHDNCTELAAIDAEMQAAIRGATLPTRHPETPRKRGAQPDNLNAIKHGFYSRHFADLELADLDETSTNLQDEIEMLRVITRRVLTLAGDMQDIDTAVSVLGALGAAATRLAGLIRTQKLLGADQSDTTAALQAALSSVVTELTLQ